MGAFGRIRCLCRGIGDYFVRGVYLPHLYREETEEFLPTIVITDGKRFHLADTLAHKPGEEVYVNAGYKICRCVRCGKKEIEWVRNLNARLPVVTAEGEVRYEMEKEATR